jgi:hypothetical protein
MNEPIIVERKDLTGQSVEVRYFADGRWRPYEVRAPGINEATFPSSTKAKETFSWYVRLDWHRSELIVECINEIEAILARKSLDASRVAT